MEELLTSSEIYINSSSDIMPYITKCIPSVSKEDIDEYEYVRDQWVCMHLCTDPISRPTIIIRS